MIKWSYLTCCLKNLSFYGIWEDFRAISEGFSFSVILSLISNSWCMQHAVNTSFGGYSK